MSGQTVVNRAKKHLGEGGKKVWDWYPLPKGSHWCCAELDMWFFECKAQRLLYGGKKVAYVPTLQIWLKAHYPKIAINVAKPGDIVIMTWSGNGYNKERGSRDHIGLIRSASKSSNEVYTIEGNTGGTSPLNSQVRERTRAARYIYGIYSPAYKPDKKVYARNNRLTAKWKYGMDLSVWQGKKSKADFEKALKDGRNFVYLRIGYGTSKTFLNEDSAFDHNYKTATQAGLRVGVYYYSKAKTVHQAKKEAKFVLKILEGRKLKLPVFIDFEDNVQINIGKAKAKKVCEAFCKIINKAGYPAGVYSYYNILTYKMDPISDKYYVWLSQTPKDTYKGRHEQWQYNCDATVKGMGKPIDVNRTRIPYDVWPKK